MAEIKNNFTGGKMNKDIDDRLIPKNEYRNAINLQISKSENSDVGSLQTVRGNQRIVDFNAFLGLPANTLECIGTLADTENDRVFLFLTDYNDTNINPVYNKLAKNYICVHNINQQTTQLLVQGNFLNFSISNPIIGVNLIEGLLFWTDNRNQPRKINVSKALSNPGAYYTTEDQISVAKLSPVYAIELFGECTEEGAIGEPETTMKNVTDEFLPDGEDNPYWDENYIGDPSYLEDKLFRFSYRYKFEDNEYSIIAPFTQIAFIPKQDGYFLYEENPIPGEEPLIDDETAAYRSTVVSFMYNKVNNIVLNIKLPSDADEINSRFKITGIEILCKDASKLAVEVIDLVPISDIVENSVGDIYSYNYQSKKPFKVLPERDLIRVSDKVPVKALAQEIAGNRVIYSNYQDKQSYPKYVNYNVGFKNKDDFNLETNKTSIVEYPNHTVKQNRTYEVGIVLGDRFGRQSGVILSNAVTGDSTFGASTLYVPYKNVGGSSTNSWPGYALNILFNNPIDGGGIDGWPGIYNGDKTSEDYNPLGWYSYKIVVKQTEQDYYNVYLPGIMAAYPTSVTKEIGKTSHVVLIGDNINKVPRDLNETSPNQTQYRSSVRLYSRVNNVVNDWASEQYYPENTFSFVNTIASNDSLFSLSTIPPDSATTGYEQFYQIDSNPLIARLSTVDKIGITYIEGNGGPPSYDKTKTIRLAVCETEPFESRLDLYWETSTSGIIEELNTAIAIESESVAYLKDWSFSLNEAAGIGDVVTGDFYFADASDVLVDVDESFIDFKVYDSNTPQNDVTSRFELVAIGGGLFRIQTADYFYFGYNATTDDSFKFKFTVLSGSPAVTSNFTREGSLSNIAPEITWEPGGDLFYESLPVTGPDVVWDFEGVNGSNPLGGVSTSELTWTITFQGYEPYPGAGYFAEPPFAYYTITSTGVLTRASTVSFPEHWRIEVRLTDAGGLFVDTSFDIYYFDA